MGKYYPERIQSNRFTNSYQCTNEAGNNLQTNGINLHTPLTTNKAGQFTAANSEYLSRTSEAALQTGDMDFTWVGWVYLDSKTANMYIAAKGNTSAATREWTLLYDQSIDRLRFFISVNGVNAASAVNANILGDVSTGVWYYIICGHDSINNQTFISVNNSDLNTASANSAPTARNGDLTIGIETTLTYTNGRISRCGFWKRFLTSAEKTYLYNQGVGLPYSQLGITGTAGSALKTSLVEYWNLDETSGTRAGSHAGLDLTDNNTVTSNPGPNSIIKAVQADGSDTMNGELSVKLKAPSLPSTNTGQQIIVTGTVNGTSPSIQCRIKLKQGSTIIATRDFTQSTASIDQTLVLTSAEAALITDYNNLFLSFITHDHTTTEVTSIELDEFYLEDTDFYPNDLTNLAAWYRSDKGVITDMGGQFTAANSEYLSRASEAALQTGDIDFTLACWLYMDTRSSGPASSAFLTKHAGGTSGEYYIRDDYANDKIVFAVNDAAGADSVYANSLGIPSATTLYFIVAWRDKTAGKINIQINNGTVDQVNSTRIPNTGANAAFNIGRRGNATDYTDGRVSRVGFWKRMLTASERTWLYNNGTGRFYSEFGQQESPDGHNLKTSLVEYWNLCEASGTRVGSHAALDLSDNNTVTSNPGPGEGPAQNNTPVKRWEDQSGNGRHASQSTLSKQPLLTLNAQNGESALNFLSTQYFMLDSVSMFRNISGATLATVMKYNTTPTANRDIFRATTPSATATRFGLFGGAVSGQLRVGGRRLDADAFDGVDGGTAPVSNFGQITGIIDYANAKAYLRQDGSAIATDDPFQTAGNTQDNNSSAGPSIAADTNGDFSMNGMIIELIVVMSVLVDPNLSSIETYLNTRYAIY